MSRFSKFRNQIMFVAISVGHCAVFICLQVGIGASSGCFAQARPQVGEGNRTISKPLRQEQGDDYYRLAAGVTRGRPEAASQSQTIDREQTTESDSKVKPAAANDPVSPLSPPNDAEYFEPSRVLARVGGEPILMSDVLFMINSIIEQNAANAPEFVKVDARKKLLPRALEAAIEQKLRFVDMNNRFPDKSKLPEFRKSIMDEIEKSAMQKVMDANNVKSREALDAKFRSLGTSLRQQREMWADQQMTTIFFQQFVSKPHDVTREEMLDYYFKHKEEKYSFPAKARFEALFVRFDRSPSPEAAWERIAAMGNEVILGANFAAVAKEKSDGFRATEGGQYDWTTQGSLREKKIDQALFSIELNKLSQIIETSDGYCIIRVLERREAGYVPYQDVQAEIKEELETKMKNEAMSNYLKELREKIPVEILVEEETGAN